MATEVIVRHCSVQWRGDFARGRGKVTADSGRLEAEYSFETRFSGGPGTNPEELLGGAIASCFTMALALVVGRAGARLEKIVTKGSVRLAQHDGGYEIAGIDLTTVVEAFGLSNDTLQKLASDALATCPVGKALRALPITLQAMQIETPARSAENA